MLDEIAKLADRDFLAISDFTIYEKDSICNEIALITPPTQGLELYTVYGIEDQGFTFQNGA